MKRAFSNISLGDGKAKVKVTLTADNVELYDKRKQQYELLTLLGQQPDLSQCQGEPFESFKMYWDGASWILEFEAVVTERKR